MRVFITVLVLIFSLQSWTKADDINDFQIEGMSIGDSLLDYFNEEEIKKFHNYDNLPSDMKFRIAEYHSDDFKMDTYDGMQVYYKPEDKKYIVFGLNGGLFCADDNMCKKQYTNITNDLKIFFNNPDDAVTKTFKHLDDKSGKSLVKTWRLNLKKGYIAVRYTNWSDVMKYSDSVDVEIGTHELYKWVMNNYGVGN